MAWDVEFRLSGGAANASALASLGGAMSSAVVGGDTATRAASPISGVSVVAAYGNAAGNGSLRYYYGASTQHFGWVPPGELSSAESPVAVPVSAGPIRICVGAGNGRGALVLDVTPALCPAADKTEGVGVAPATGALFDAVGPERARTGGNDYRCVYLRNGSATLTYTLHVWVSGQPAGGAQLALAADPAGVGGTALAIAAATADPGLVFAAPASVLDGGLVSLVIPPGAAAPLWLRRAVPPMSMVSASLVLGRLGISAEAV